MKFTPRILSLLFLVSAVLCATNATAQFKPNRFTTNSDATIGSMVLTNHDARPVYFDGPLTADTNNASTNMLGGSLVILGQSVLEGAGNTATPSRAAHAEGEGTSATAFDAHAEGNTTAASGIAAHAEGLQTTASGSEAHAEGGGTTASGIASHAEGFITTASGTASHAAGQYANATNSNSYVFSDGTTTNGSGTNKTFNVYAKNGINLRGGPVNADSANIAGILAVDTLTGNTGNTIEMKRGTTSQRFNLYDTFTDNSNYRRLSEYFASGDLVVGLDALGTGTASGNFKLLSGLNHTIFFQFGGDTFGDSYYNMDTTRFTPSPARDNIPDLGGLDRRWRSGFFGTSLTVSGGFITNGGVVIYNTNGTPQVALPDGSICLQTGGQPWLRTNGNWIPINVSGSGGGGSDFPLTGDVSAAGHSITGLGSLSVTGAITSDILIATNFFTPTNALSGTTIDFAAGSETTIKLSGNLTFTGYANISPSNYNTVIIHMLPGGADRNIAFPAGCMVGTNDTKVVPANGVSAWLVSLQSGVFTNAFQLDAVP